jgi:hypothetical protein
MPAASPQNRPWSVAGAGLPAGISALVFVRTGLQSA